jgi:FixJ family two-component response regulator
LAQRPLICIVASDQLLRDFIEDLLRSAAYDVAAFHSAQAYLLSADRRDSSCLIVDLQLAGMNANDLQDRLTVYGHRCPIIFLNDPVDKRARIRAVRAGAFSVLPKPVDPSQLLDNVKKATADPQ